MSERAELICRLMVELGAEFEGLVEATMRQQRPGCCQSNAKPSPASCGIGLLSSEQPTPFREGDVSHRFECRAVVEVAV